MNKIDVLDYIAIEKYGDSSFTRIRIRGKKNAKTVLSNFIADTSRLFLCGIFIKEKTIPKLCLSAFHFLAAFQF